MKFKFTDWAYGILAFLPLIIASIVFTTLPSTIPAHINAAGQADRYGNRSEIFFIPIFILIVTVFIWLLFY